MADALSEMIRRVLREAPFAMRQLAADSGLSYDVLRSWRSGRRRPSRSSAARLAAGLEERGQRLLLLARELQAAAEDEGTDRPRDTAEAAATPERPAERAEAPGERAEAPAERAEAPGERAEVSGERVEAPAERTAQPAELSPREAERSTQPADRSTQPADRAAKPADRSLETTARRWEPTTGRPQMAAEAEGAQDADESGRRPSS